MDFDNFKKCSCHTYEASGCASCDYCGWLLSNGKPASDKLGMTPKLKALRKKEADKKAKLELQRKRTHAFYTPSR